ncbi:MAG: ABC transporter substrate-binding protein [Candidatus Heimdallarchaeaceae archaeon]
MKKKAILLTFFAITILTIGFSIVTTAQVGVYNPSKDKVDGTVLTIITRHDVTITDTFKSAFLSSSYATAAGVTDVKFFQATTDEGWKLYLQDPSKSVDLAWGGGPSLFNTMEKWGLLKHIDNTTLINYLNSKVPDTIAGAEMKLNDSSGNLVWIANAISSFGFTVNHDFLSTYGLPVPHTWEELASPTYYINPTVKAISMGDPPLTTSNTRIYQIILQAFGWDDGWSILTRMGGNAGIYPGSVDTRAAVVSGEVGIAMTIDFYGVIAHRENPNTEYIVPEGQSIVNGDPIAKGINVDDEDAANAFLEYVFSDEGQSVWLTEGLDRLPVNEGAFNTPLGQTANGQALYSLFNDTIKNKGIDFNETLATSNLDTTIYYFHNTITEKHGALRKAWGEMVTQLRDSTINSTIFQDYVERLGTVNMTLEQSIEWNDDFTSDPLFAAELESKWRAFASAKYNEIYCELIGGCETSTPTPTETTTKTPYFILPVIFTTISLAMLVVIRKRRRN